MNINNNKPSLQDYSLINTYVDKYCKEQELNESRSLGFMFFMIDLILNLQDDEIEDAITDTAYLSQKGLDKGHDRGIDAVYLDESEHPTKIHFFNFKYTNRFENMPNHFPANEIDKIISFLQSLMQKDNDIQSTVNPVLYSKIQDIWNIFNEQNPHFYMHICSNFYNGFENKEAARFAREIMRYSNFSIEYHLTPWIVSRLTSKQRKSVNAKIKAIDKNLFEKSDGDIRALIVNIDAQDLLRIVIDDDKIRNDTKMEDYSILKNHKILEDAFEDNVRLYLKRSKINKNIRETALSDSAHRFFYFNNGITITCSNFKYPKQLRAPVIELENLQIVNGSQTIHSLFDAFTEKSEEFENIDILARIYETRNETLSTSIAEYTNSQNPVQSRDIRSNDFIQRKLAKELEALGYFYERKKRQYPDKTKSARIDSEKAGQALLAFFNKMPAEAKDAKRIIFASKYDEIFNDEITADSILLTISLFNEIELKKKEQKNIFNEKNYENESFISHASYYILYVLSELTEINQIQKKYNNFQKIIDLYDQSVTLIKTSVQKEKDKLIGYQESYTHRMFFKSNHPKKHIEALLSNYHGQSTNNELKVK